MNDNTGTVRRSLRHRVVDGYRRLQRPLRLNAWFPHLPLALLVGFLGLLQIAAGDLHLAEGQWFDGFQQGVDAIAGVFGEAPGVIVGIFLLIMAVGLVLRSRFAWSVVLLSTIISLVISLLSGQQAIDALFVYNAVVLVLLFFAEGAFNRSSLASGTLFALTGIIALMAYAVLGSYQLGGQFDPPIRDLTTALYFSMVTMSTVGYGDITPQTGQAMLFVVSLIVLGITVFAASISAVLVPIINSRVTRLLRINEGRMERHDHYVIAGNTPLARNVWKELRSRGQQVTFILPSAPADGSGEELDAVAGDSSNLDVLRNAGADKARAILALGDDDAENAFVILAMKDLAEHVTTVATVNNAKNMPSMKRVSPDLIIAPDVLGGELLAMALSGERLDQQHVVDRLLHFRD